MEITILGCDDPLGTNYDSTTNCNDGTCDYPADFDGNGEVNTSDLLELLANFGCFGPACPADLNGDGEVNTSDILIFLIYFGAGTSTI